MLSRNPGRRSGASLPAAKSKSRSMIKYKDDNPFDSSDDSLSDIVSDTSEYEDTRKKVTGKRKRTAQDKAADKEAVKKCRAEDKEAIKRRRAEDKEAAKKRRAEEKAERRYGKTPAVPEMSDDDSVEFDDDSEDEDSGLWATTRGKGKEPAQDLSLQLVGGSGETASVDLNVTLGDLLKNHLGIPDLCSGDLNLAPNIDTPAPGMDIEGDTLVSVSDKHGDKLSFLDLPPEVRVSIYRQVFRGARAVDFTRRTNFSHSAALLGTCKQVHEEGRVILYGENSFHFSRCYEHRGKYWEQDWEEVGFKDVRRFLETIGPVNLSHIKYMSFMLTDASARNCPVGSANSRRFVNEPTLQRVFRLIAANTTLRKLGVLFGGRARVTANDYHFLKAFTEMKCHKLVILRSFRAFDSKLHGSLKAKMESVMVVPFDDKDRINPNLISKNQVGMVYEENDASNYLVKLM